MSITGLAVSNDNIQSRARYRENDHAGSQERLIRFIPVAVYLIKTYVDADWKTDPHNDGYAFTEYMICSTLYDYKRSSRNSSWDLEMIAPILGVHKIILLNNETLKEMINRLYSF